jgi:hypothetical protein
VKLIRHRQQRPLQSCRRPEPATRRMRPPGTVATAPFGRARPRVCVSGTPFRLRNDIPGIPPAMVLFLGRRLSRNSPVRSHFGVGGPCPSGRPGFWHRSCSQRRRPGTGRGGN